MNNYIVRSYRDVIVGLGGLNQVYGPNRPTPSGKGICGSI